MSLEILFPAPGFNEASVPERVVLLSMTDENATPFIKVVVNVVEKRDAGDLDDK